MLKPNFNKTLQNKRPYRANFFYIKPLSINQEDLQILYNQPENNENFQQNYENKKQQNVYCNQSTFMSTLPNSDQNYTFNQKNSLDSENSKFYSLSLKLIKKKNNYLNDYLFVGMLGKGTFGKVSKLKHKKTGRLYAAKIIQKSYSSQQNNIKLQKFKKQIDIYQQISHPYIISLHEIYFFKNEFTLIMQYFPAKNLYKVSQYTNFYQLTQQKIANIIFQLVCALQYLHNLSIIHHDIKLQNILYDPQTQQTKIIDFGQAIKLQEQKQFIQNQGGTYAYFAPEIFQDKCSTKIDIWACGVVLYYLLSGKIVFYEKDYIQMKKNIIIQDLMFQGYIWKKRSQEVKDLLKLMLQKNPEKRISARQIRQSKWIQQFKFIEAQTYYRIQNQQLTDLNQTNNINIQKHNFSLYSPKNPNKIIPNSIFKTEKQKEVGNRNECEQFFQKFK